MLKSGQPALCVGLTIASDNNMIRLNEHAPEFTAESTHGPIQLSQFKGRWVILFSHPGDFTPVCTSEFLSFARRAEDFEKLKCSLIGLSVDSVFSHIAWCRNIEEKFGVRIPFPVLSDISMQISSMYGMIQPAESHTSAVRALFVIDDHGVLRAMLYYPQTAGRSVDEVLRLVRSLQTSDAYDVATPEGWQPGDPVIVSPPATLNEAEGRLQTASKAGLQCTDWYFCRRSVSTTKKSA